MPIATLAHRFAMLAALLVPLALTTACEDEGALEEGEEIGEEVED
jgi:hypothetical protein